MYLILRMETVNRKRQPKLHAVHWKDNGRIFSGGLDVNYFSKAYHLIQFGLNIIAYLAQTDDS